MPGDENANETLRVRVDGKGGARLARRERRAPDRRRGRDMSHRSVREDGLAPLAPAARRCKARKTARHPDATRASRKATLLS